MKKRILIFILAVSFVSGATAQTDNLKSGLQSGYVPVVGIVKDIPDSTLLEIVQRQTFRYFWHNAHPVSGLARERSDTVMAVHYWDYINEAWDEPNFGRVPFGPDACAIGGTGFGILATIVAVERGWIARGYKI